MEPQANDLPDVLLDDVITFLNTKGDEAAQQVEL